MHKPFSFGLGVPWTGLIGFSDSLEPAVKEKAKLYELNIHFRNRLRD